MNQEHNSQLQEAFTKAHAYVHAYLQGNAISIERLRYSFIQLVRQNSFDEFTRKDGMAMVNQLIDEYISDPVLFDYNLWDSANPDLSIINIFKPSPDSLIEIPHGFEEKDENWHLGQ